MTECVLKGLKQEGNARCLERKEKNNPSNMGDILERGETRCFCSILGKRAFDHKTAIKIYRAGASLEILQR